VASWSRQANVRSWVSSRAIGWQCMFAPSAARNGSGARRVRGRRAGGRPRRGSVVPRGGSWAARFPSAGALADAAGQALVPVAPPESHRPTAMGSPATTRPATTAPPLAPLRRRRREEPGSHLVAEGGQEGAQVFRPRARDGVHTSQVEAPVAVHEEVAEPGGTRQTGPEGSVDDAGVGKQPERVAVGGWAPEPEPYARRGRQVDDDLDRLPEVQDDGVGRGDIGRRSSGSSGRWAATRSRWARTAAVRSARSSPSTARLIPGRRGRRPGRRG
jgi:hypothetical protein